MRNFVKRRFVSDTTWTAPAGVTFVQAYARTAVQNIGAGQQYAGALDATGQVWMWGRNLQGQLGTGNSNDNFFVSSPVAVIGGIKFSQLAIGFDSVIAITSDGTLYGWGANGNGELATGDLIARSSPVAAVGGIKFRSITCAGGYSLGISTTGVAYAWGSGAGGATGLGDHADRSSPVAIVGGISFASLSAGGGSSFGVDANGNGWAWGINDFGQLGDGTTTARSSPVQIVGGIKFTQISANENRNPIGLDVNGNMWTWGYDSVGQGGRGTFNVAVSSPVLVVGGLKGRYVSGGEDWDMIIDTSGAAWGWGSNNAGQIGNGTNSTTYSSPVATIGSHTFVSIVGGDEHTIALSTDGKLYAWGANFQGELGIGSLVNKSSPTLVLGSLSMQTMGSVSQNIFDVSPGVSYSVSVSTSSFAGNSLASTASGEIILVYEA